MIVGTRMIPRAVVALVLAAMMIVVGGGSASAADPVPRGPGSCQEPGGGISPQYRAILDQEFRDLKALILAHNAEPHVFRPGQEDAHRDYDAEASSLNGKLTNLRGRAQGALAIPSDLAVTTCRPLLPVPWGGVIDYQNGGQRDAMQHILHRHGPATRFTDVSRFLPNTRPADIQRWVDHVMRQPATTFTHSVESGRSLLDSYKIVGPAGTIVGTGKPDVNGVPGPRVDHLEIYVRDGVIRTAYPVANPTTTRGAGN